MATLLEKINQAKTNTENGKTLIANAITSKGVETPVNSTYQVMADNISAITSGGGSGEIVGQKKITLPLAEDIGDMETATKINWITEKLTNNYSVKVTCSGADISANDQYFAICSSGGYAPYIGSKDENGTYKNKMSLDVGLSSDYWIPHFSPTGKHLAFTVNSTSSAFRVYKLVGNQYMKLPDPNPTVRAECLQVEWINDDVFVASFATTGNIFIYKIENDQLVKLSHDETFYGSHYNLSFEISNGYVIVADKFNGIKFLKIGEDFNLTKETFTNQKINTYSICKIDDTRFICTYSDTEKFLITVDFNAKSVTKKNFKVNDTIKPATNGYWSINTKLNLVAMENKIFKYNLETMETTDCVHPWNESGYSFGLNVLYARVKFVRNGDYALVSTNVRPYYNTLKNVECIKKANNKFGNGSMLGYLPQGGTAGQNKEMVVLFER